MTIDEMYDWLYRLKSEILVFMPKEWHEPMRDSIQDAITFSRKYQMMQADYNARLRADMVAMLTEIQLEIDELVTRPGWYGYGAPTFSSDYIRKVNISEIIQQKINALKAESEEKE